jgi:hypothetical protein
VVPERFAEVVALRARTPEDAREDHARLMRIVVEELPSSDVRVELLDRLADLEAFALLRVSGELTKH